MASQPDSTAQSNPPITEIEREYERSLARLKNAKAELKVARVKAAKAEARYQRCSSGEQARYGGEMNAALDAAAEALRHVGKCHIDADSAEKALLRSMRIEEDAR